MNSSGFCRLLKCTNPKCVKKHYSGQHSIANCNRNPCKNPECLFVHKDGQQEISLCMWNPCKNPKCLFKHNPDQKATAQCMYGTCTNPYCLYVHIEGQHVIPECKFKPCIKDDCLYLHNNDQKQVDQQQIIPKKSEYTSCLTCKARFNKENYVECPQCKYNESLKTKATAENITKINYDSDDSYESDSMVYYGNLEYNDGEN